VNQGPKRGFTLIEMMVVVVIVGILATLAVVGYRKLVQSSHVTEATNMVQSIRVAQEAYHSETQQYADISNTLTAWYPNATPTGRQYTAWGSACATQCSLDWSVLPLHVDGPVAFGYATRAGAPNTNPSAIAPLPGPIQASLTLPLLSATEWYVVTAMCDIDGLGAPNTYVATSSWGNQVFTFFDGQ
jgi:type IV pilus assembly protein PilA